MRSLVKIPAFKTYFPDDFPVKILIFKTYFPDISMVTVSVLKTYFPDAFPGKGPGIQYASRCNDPGIQKRISLVKVPVFKTYARSWDSKRISLMLLPGKDPGIQNVFP